MRSSRASTIYTVHCLSLLFCYPGAASAAKQLNDTGMSLCLQGDALTKECSGTGQDGEFGRDVTKNYKKDGRHGFSFVKVCNSGEQAGVGTCPADPVLGGGNNDWGCTQDKVTQLIWEVKTASGLRGWKNAYTYRGDGSPGEASELVAQVNAQGLCGAKDWRLPTQAQLHSLVDYSVAAPGPVIDSNWFPQTASGKTASSRGLYWTADVYAADPEGGGWAVEFADGTVTLNDRCCDHLAVRLVRTAK